MSAHPKSPAALVATLALGLLGSLGGCTSCDDVNCGLGAENPPFDPSRTRIADDFRAFPAWAHYEFSVRPELLADFGAGWMKGRKDEIDATGARIANLPSAVANDFRYHGGSMVDYVDRSAERAGDDACCFFARAWHTIRQTLE